MDKIKDHSGTTENGTYLKSGDSLFYGENGGKKLIYHLELV